jgi:hypothetical protein
MRQYAAMPGFATYNAAYLVPIATLPPCAHELRTIAQRIKAGYFMERGSILYFGMTNFSTWLPRSFSVYVHGILFIGHSAQRLSNNLF